MANRKISDLTALTAPATGDLLPIVDISEAAAADKNKKITYLNFLNNIPTGTITSTMILDDTIVNGDINASAAIVDTKLATIATAGKVSNSATTAASVNTASAIVARDASGNFTAGTITAALTGAASSNVLKAGDTMTGVLAVTAGTAALPGIAVSGDLNTGLVSPGADQLAITTGGTSRLAVSTTAVSSTLAVDVPLGAVGTPSITFTGDLNTGLFSPGADTVALVTGGTNRVHVTSGGLVGINTNSPGSALEINAAAATSPFIAKINTAEAARIDSSARLLVGTSNAPTVGDPQYGLICVQGNTSSASGFGLLSIGRGQAAASITSGSEIGHIYYTANDGSPYASVSAYADNTSGSGDYPGRLVLSTTADGAAIQTEALRITNDKVIAYNQPTPTSKSAAATLTIAELKTGIIQYTGAAATLTLPTGTLMEGGFNGIYTNMAFEWSVINTGSGTCTIGAGTAHTIVGSATVASGASARFASRRTAANTFVSYRRS